MSEAKKTDPSLPFSYVAKKLAGYAFAALCGGGLASGIVVSYLDHRFETQRTVFESRLKVAQDLRAQREDYLGLVESASAEYFVGLSELTAANSPGDVAGELLTSLKGNLLEQTLILHSLKTALGEHEEAVDLISQYQESLDLARTALDSVVKNDPGELAAVFVSADRLASDYSALFNGVRNLRVEMPPS